MVRGVTTAELGEDFSSSSGQFRSRRGERGGRGGRSIGVGGIAME